MSSADLLHISVAPEVQEAIEAGRPVVALESCVWAQGLPRPMNYDVAQETLEVIREMEAVPAIVAISDGKGRIGISDEELRTLCRGNCVKAGVGDIPGLIVSQQHASTTVSASIQLAHKVGLKVFATGGLGGVHPHWTRHFDVSADMSQIVRSQTLVVCSGIKSVLDISTTVELLETLGVPVGLYRTDYFPRFYAAGEKVEIGSRLDTVSQVVNFYRASVELLGRGVLIANPVPAEKQLPNDELDKYLEKGMEICEREHHMGKSLTPFLLDYMARESRGATLEANRALLISNARLAAKIAVAMARENV